MFLRYASEKVSLHKLDLLQLDNKHWVGFDVDGLGFKKWNSDDVEVTKN